MKSDKSLKSTGNSKKAWEDLHRFWSSYFTERSCLLPHPFIIASTLLRHCCYCTVNVATRHWYHAVLCRAVSNFVQCITQYYRKCHRSGAELVVSGGFLYLTEKAQVLEIGFTPVDQLGNDGSGDFEPWNNMYMYVPKQCTYYPEYNVIKESRSSTCNHINRPCSFWTIHVRHSSSSLKRCIMQIRWVLAALEVQNHSRLLCMPYVRGEKLLPK